MGYKIREPKPPPYISRTSDPLPQSYASILVCKAIKGYSDCEAACARRLAGEILRYEQNICALWLDHMWPGHKSPVNRLPGYAGDV